jgi:hypothetical protein
VVEGWARTGRWRGHALAGDCFRPNYYSGVMGSLSINRGMIEGLSERVQKEGSEATPARRGCTPELLPVSELGYRAQCTAAGRTWEWLNSTVTV